MFCLCLRCLTIIGVLRHEKSTENDIMTGKHTLEHKNTQIMSMWMTAVTISLRTADFIKPVAFSFELLLNYSREDSYIS